MVWTRRRKNRLSTKIFIRVPKRPGKKVLFFIVRASFFPFLGYYLGKELKLGRNQRPGSILCLSVGIGDWIHPVPHSIRCHSGIFVTSFFLFWGIFYLSLVRKNPGSLLSLVLSFRGKAKEAFLLSHKRSKFVNRIWQRVTQSLSPGSLFCSFCPPNILFGIQTFPLFWTSIACRSDKNNSFHS